MQAGTNASGLSPKPHTLTLENRSHLAISGVVEVESFDETAVCLSTSQGRMVIQGQNLQLQQLSMEGGNILVDGHVEALLYEQERPSGSWLQRLFG